MANTKSSLPDGGYQPTYASNLMLDGFDFSEDYGEGVLTGRKDPDPDLPRSTKGLAGLPDGFVSGGHTATEEEFGDDTWEDGFGNLGGYLKSASPLVDLSWLETATQDPDRLPKSPNDAVLQGLVEAWGVNRRTNGVDLVPNVQLQPQPKSMVARLPGDQFRDLVTSAMRRSAFGDTFDNIIRDTASHLGEDLMRVHELPQLQKLAVELKRVASEHGVVGKVYLRDEAFPALLTGKWDTAIKKRCASALYWLTKPGSKLSAYQNYLGKKVVTEIPWGEAREHFRPTLEASGRKVASGDPKATLLAALATEVTKTRKEAGVPVTSPVDTITAEKAWKIFATAPIPVREVVARKDNTLRLAQVQIARWVSSGLLSKDDAQKLLRSGVKAESLVKIGAARIAASGKPVEYMGHGINVTPVTQMSSTTDVKASQDTLDLAQMDRAKEAVVGLVKAGSLTKAEGDRLFSSGLSAKDLLKFAQARVQDPNRVVPLPKVANRKYAGAEFNQNSKVQDTVRGATWAAEQEQKIAQVQMDRARDTVFGLVKAGSLSQKDADKVLASGLAPKQMVRVAEMRAQDPNKPTTLPTVDTRTYADTQYTHHVAEKRAQEARPTEVTKLLRWASIQMNEGMAGRDLSDLLKAKFAVPLLKQANAPLVQLRKKHEGLAGHLYVDASAYASVTGTTGCDKGGLAHRANAIPAVLEMPRCASCAFNTDKHCQKYSKELVSEVSVGDVGGYQKDVIRLANSDDSEKVAALFNPKEYDLQNDNLDFEYDSFPTHEALNDVLFQGMVVPTDKG